MTRRRTEVVRPTTCARGTIVSPLVEQGYSGLKAMFLLMRRVPCVVFTRRWFPARVRMRGSAELSSGFVLNMLRGSTRSWPDAVVPTPQRHRQGRRSPAPERQPFHLQLLRGEAPAAPRPLRRGCAVVAFGEGADRGSTALRRLRRAACPACSASAAAGGRRPGPAWTGHPASASSALLKWLLRPASRRNRLKPWRMARARTPGPREDVPPFEQRPSHSPTELFAVWSLVFRGSNSTPRGRDAG